MGSDSGALSFIQDISNLPHSLCTQIFDDTEPNAGVTKHEMNSDSVKTESRCAGGCGRGLF